MKTIIMLSDKDLNNRLTHVPSVVYPYVIVVLMMNAIKMIDSLSISSLLLSYFRYTGRFCNHYFDEHVFSIIFQLYERIKKHLSGTNDPDRCFFYQYLIVISLIIFNHIFSCAKDFTFNCFASWCAC